MMGWISEKTKADSGSFSGAVSGKPIAQRPWWEQATGYVYTGFPFLCNPETIAITITPAINPDTGNPYSINKLAYVYFGFPSELYTAGFSAEERIGSVSTTGSEVSGLPFCRTNKYSSQSMLVVGAYRSGDEFIGNKVSGWTYFCTYVQWEQDNEKFEGLPFVHETAIAPAIDLTDENLSIWKITSGTFFSLPYIEETGIAPEWGAVSIWDIREDTFFGLPYIKATGIAPQYRQGFSNLYLGSGNVQNLTCGTTSVSRVYSGSELILEKG